MEIWHFCKLGLLLRISMYLSLFSGHVFLKLPKVLAAQLMAIQVKDKEQEW